MEQDTFVIERTIDAPLERVWAAITDPSQMKHWYFDVPMFKAEEGAEFRFSGGPDAQTQFLHVCRVTEVIPNKRLTHSWRYEGYPGDSQVTWELFPEGKKTRVRLTHTGLSTFDPNNPAFARNNFAMGWTSIVGESLPGFLATE